MINQINEYPGYYVNKHGDIYSKNRNQLGPIYPLRLKVLSKNKYGYYQAILCRNGKRKTYLVHRLIAKMYIPNPENKPQINHKNGIKIDNRVENLEWCTNIENIRHAEKMGLRNYKGEKNPKAKLKEKDVIEIKKLLNQGNISQIKIAKRYGVNPPAINAIKTGRRWHHIGEIT